MSETVHSAMLYRLSILATGVMTGWFIFSHLGMSSSPSSDRTRPRRDQQRQRTDETRDSRDLYTNRMGHEDSRIQDSDATRTSASRTSERLQTLAETTVSPRVNDLPDSSDMASAESVAQLLDMEESKSLLALLFNIAEDQAHKDGFIHRSITCNKCGESPIRGYRFRCLNCLDYDLCEHCESLDQHNKIHVFAKIRIPIPPLANPRTALLPAFYPGDEFTLEDLGVDFVPLQQATQFDVVELEALYQQFRSLSDGDTGIDSETFEKCLGPLGCEKNLITSRIFSFFDRNDDGYISFPEMAKGLSVLCKGGLDERIEYAFKGYDLDNDGYISRDELRKMFKAYFQLSMELVRDVVKTMEESLIESFDDEAAKPVSASFSAPIRGSSYTENDSDGEEGSSASTSRRRRFRKASGRTKGKSPVRHPIESSPERHNYLPHRLVVEPESSGSWASEASPTGVSSIRDTLERAKRYQRKPVPGKRTVSFESIASSPSFQSAVLASPTLSPFPLSPQNTNLLEPLNEEPFPVMETMSQDAIEEMVTKTFLLAGIEKGDYMSLEQFKDVVGQDNNILGWFEALGSVF